MSNITLYISNDNDLPDKIFQGDPVPFTEKIILDERHALSYRPISPDIKSEIITDRGVDYKQKVSFMSRYEISFVINRDTGIFLSRLKMYDTFVYTDYRGETITPDEWEIETRAPDNTIDSHFIKVIIRVKYDLKSKYAKQDNYVEAGVANTAPYASGVEVTGGNTLGSTLTCNYTYNDDEGDPEGATEFRWFRADDALGTNSQLISGASSQTYVIQLEDLNKYVKAQVKAVATSGELEGDWVGSDWFAIGTNYAPVASSVSVDKTVPKAGETVTGSYNYSDVEGDLEDTGSTEQYWYIADDEYGLNETFWDSGSSTSFTAIEIGKFFKYGVRPHAQSGITPGEWVYTDYEGPIAPPL